MSKSFVYFMPNKYKDEIYIGYDGSGTRIASHEKEGYSLLAAIPGTETHEDLLHQHFSPYKVSRNGTNSHYHFDKVAPYAKLLLDLHYATAKKEDIEKLPPIHWGLWSPDTVLRPLYDGKQGCLFITEGVKSHLRDTWQTPQEIADICKRALGGKINLDPASCYEANERIGADYYFDERVNGLIQSWEGGDSVFMNPPYANPPAEIFVQKLINEIHLGHVKKAITVLNLQSLPTLWFPETAWKEASSHAVFRKRINFIGPRAKSGSGAKAFASSKNGTIFSFFGEGDDVKLFEETFAPYALVFRRCL